MAYAVTQDPTGLNCFPRDPRLGLPSTLRTFRSPPETRPCAPHGSRRSHDGYLLIRAPAGYATRHSLESKLMQGTGASGFGLLTVKPPPSGPTVATVGPSTSDKPSRRRVANASLQQVELDKRSPGHRNWKRPRLTSLFPRKAEFDRDKIGSHHGHETSINHSRHQIFSQSIILPGLRSTAWKRVHEPFKLRTASGFTNVYKDPAIVETVNC
jgi:hypothetical protein